MPPYCPPKEESYCQTSAFDNLKDNLKLIGPKGHNFIRLTNKLQIKYLWWNKEQNIIEIWGGQKQIIYAQKYIKKYLQRFKKKHCTNTLKRVYEDENVENIKRMKL